MECLICHKILSNKGLGSHLISHNITAKEYYDTYMKKPDEEICPICGKNTPFLKICKGYQRFCSISCSQRSKDTREKFKETFRKNHNGAENNFQIKEIQIKAEKKANTKEALEKKKLTSLEHYNVENPAQSEEVKQRAQQTNLIKYGYRAYNKEKGKQTMLERYNCEHALQNPDIKRKQEQTEYNKWRKYAKDNNYLFVQDLLKEYGTGWYQSELGKSIVFVVGQQAFIKREDLDKIIQYINTISTSYSYKEKELVSYIKTFYSGLIYENTRKVIGRAELDVYLPELNLAIEYNGNYFHCIEANTNKNYHLRKSLLCRKKNIRLIHIYEFEDFNKQKQLLKDLILGVDNYNKEDFNKNNLIDNIPQPIIIFKNDKYTIYGAGKLYIDEENYV